MIKWVSQATHPLPPTGGGGVELDWMDGAETPASPLHATLQPYVLPCKFTKWCQFLHLYTRA